MVLCSLELKVPPVVLVAAAASGTYCIANRVESEWKIPRGVRVPALILGGAAGLLSMLAGVREFGRASTTVNPTTPGACSSLVSSGIYGYTRNPMYVGMLLCLLGWSAFLGGHPYTFFPPALFVAYLNKFQILPEERTLAKIFGAEFDTYCSVVRRWL
eukprot:TRINITY_DN1137_c0_g1_i1.p1 TRINITY_DN1137_c0_g1~~TRINITY_DN1137_c0_g1_i1.p1  ORF type:complete len:179 (+),score=16.27 TRINITY_DN1137_c0_g1_i1:64-537(+)